ncbi:L-threonylcarbamoyladenylate synthase [Halorhabdus salina]|uniref:L-threonylcarbamoyladenylate synthase n=1 Tax=Halorhabdus salina TaxID=2750670 RepID=UPI0015EF15B0|nr:L-threonylcarbamoyladenylate synthase [Halorhabdus salina]
MDSEQRLQAAAEAIESGKLVVYPTETVYGLGADALDPEAVEAVFAAKRRDRSEPISLGVADVPTALEYVDAGEREQAFMREFLPGPVTVVVKRAESIPDVLTAGRERVGVRVPDHDLSRRVLEITGPLTATSANVSGQESATRAEEVDREIHDAADVVLDGGETAGQASTVVDVSDGTIHRRGANADAVAAWLDVN